MFIHMEKMVIAIVTNYGFSENADALKARLSPYYKTLLLDNSSPNPPRTADYILPNHNYTGLWNAAVRLAIEHKKPWLLFVASDVQIPDVALMAGCMQTILMSPSAGIYTPSLRHDSRLSYDACFQRATNKIRECYITEGFFFLARTDILARLYPVSQEENRFGYGIDLMAAYHAYRTGHTVLVDDRVVIFHPAAVHSTPVDIAVEDQIKYMGRSGQRFRKWANQRLRYEGTLREVPRLLARACYRPLLRALDSFSPYKKAIEFHHA